MDRITRACDLARALARSPEVRSDADGRARSVVVAMGDPQAPLEHVVRVLDANGLLGGDGRVREDVALYSMGDHFDWGGASDVEAAREDGLALLAWLSAHAADHVHLVLGNHDLARVGELATFDDARFREAQALATPIYARHDDAAERDLLTRFPALPSAEVAARDFASFTVAQRDLVVRVLRAKRFRLAFAPAADILLTHAGITAGDLAGIGCDSAGAGSIARALNDRLDRAWASWNGSPLSIPALHDPGDAAHGEGGGILYHRPTSAPITPESAPRRFDPRHLPRGLTQVIGHIADAKCRALMPAWIAPGATASTKPGELRTLLVASDSQGATLSYASGVLPLPHPAGDAARMVFTDGGMRHVTPSAYALLDVTAMKPLVPPPL